MITHWILNNFKSIEKEKDFDFRPLTIFAGANSSGKSTVLQSMLLVAQTIQNSIKSRSIVLNGHISKFGSYKDIVTNNDVKRKIKIGFNILPNTSDSLKRRKYFGPFDDSFLNIKCEFEVSANSELEFLQPILEYVEISTTDQKQKETKLVITKSKKNFGERIKEYKLSESMFIDKNALEYEINDAFKARARYWMRNYQNMEYIGSSMTHFLPEYIIGYYNKKDSFSKAITKLFTSNIPYNFDEDNIKEFLTPDLIKIFLNCVDEIKIENINPLNKNDITLKIKNIHQKFSLNKLINIISIANASDIIKSKKDLILNKINKMPDSLHIENFPMYYSSEISFINEYFRNEIKYLGPLRDEPKSIYPLESSTSSTDVGFKGENTAAVLEYNKSQKIKYIASKEFTNLKIKEPEISVVTLHQAINDWLIYLGIANDIQTNDKGKFGHELKISTDNPSLKHDLTHVGVGVSQVLPILVLSFLAERDSVLVFEQPELHLHPKVQTRLADFFVAMNILGKQCIVETHSEYLINRLRYLVAKSEDTKISDDSIIYFVEKEDGESIYRPITINKYGVIEDWPKGFFDESESIASEILRAGMEKKRNEQSSQK